MEEEKEEDRWGGARFSGLVYPYNRRRIRRTLFFFKREMCVARDAFQLEYRKNNAIIFLVQHVSGYLFSLKEIVGCTSRYVWFSSSWSRIELQKGVFQ